MESSKIGSFTCLICGQTFEMPHAHNRKYCPECAKIAKRESMRKTNHEARQQAKANASMAAFPTVNERRKLDAKMDARSAKYIELQCRFCAYRLYNGSTNVTYGCDHLIKTGRRADKGNGPGDCRSFKHKDEVSRNSRIDYRKKNLALLEADFAPRT